MFVQSTHPTPVAGCRAKGAAENSQNAPFYGTKRSILRMIRSIPVSDLAAVMRIPVPAAACIPALIAVTAESDWLPGGRPVVFQQQSSLARDTFAVTSRTVRRYEAALEQAGLIRRATGGNGHRSGHEKTGLDLSPILQRLPEIEALLAAVLSRRAMHSAEIGEAKRLRRMIVAQIEDMPEAVRRRIHRCMGWIPAWPRRLADLSLSHLSRHVAFLRRLARWITFASFRHDEMQPGMSGASDTAVRPYTTEEPIESCSFNEDGKQEAPGESEQRGLRDTEDSGHRNIALKQPHYPPARITPEAILSVATPLMRAHLRGFEPFLHPASGAQAQQVLSDIARTRAFELGIDRWLLDKASRALPPVAFLMAVLVLDTNRSHPVAAHRTRNPGALLLTFLRRANIGALDLNSALLGIIDRVQKGRQVPSEG